MKMTVLYVKDTGQVMAAVTRAALAETAPAAAADGATPEVVALVGDSLPVRSFLEQGTGLLNPTLFSIPADQLAALTVERDEDQLLSPRNYTVLDSKKLEVALPPAALPGVTTPVGDPSTVVVTLPADAASDLPLALHLVPEAGTAGGSQHFQGVFKPATPTVRELRFRLRAPLAGDYGVLILLKGYLPAMQHLTV
jgi:hypothetical protein